MTPMDWQRVRAAFHGALARPPDERALFLRSEFRDSPELELEIAVMLSAHDEASTSSVTRARVVTDSNATTPRASTASTVSNTLLAGTQLGPYEIEKLIGIGGMGQVYLARNLALGRPAALKLLLPDVTERGASLAREADLAARLQHPCIATFYELLELDTGVAIAMEYVAGESLRQVLKRGPLPLARARTITECLLEALAHAHAVGVIHRDIKPENIVVSEDGSAKLLEFGVALFIAKESSDRANQFDEPDGTRSIVGTLAYMSPEQLGGETVDARTDLFAVGAVLYEMISGRPAFVGDTVKELWAAVFRCEPQRLPDGQCPEPVREVVVKALSASSDMRFGTAREFLTALKRATPGGSTGVLPNVLAVLDFENVLHNAAVDWVSRGIAESLSAKLRSLREIKVLPLDRVWTTKESAEGDTTPRTIGLELGCRWVVSGAFAADGPSLDVLVQLMEVSTGEVLLNRRFDADISSIAELQHELATACASVLGATPDFQTYGTSSFVVEMYSRGRNLRTSLAKGKLQEARELYERAVEADPEFAPALAELAAVHCLQFTFTTDRRDLENGLGYSVRAIEADPANAHAHVWQGYALARLDRHEEALAAELRAMELDPTDFYGPYFGGVELHQLGRRTEAITLLQRAVANGPFAGTCWLLLGWTQLCVNRIVEARYSLSKALALEGGRNSVPGAAAYLGECLRRAGMYEAARVHCLLGLDSIEQSDHVYRDTLRAFALCALGRTALEKSDIDTARVAFSHVLSQVHGRPSALGVGHLLVQAFAGMTRVGEDSQAFEQGVALFESREDFNFQYFHGCHDDVTLLELARAAWVLDRRREAELFLARARESGSLEPVAWGR